MRTLLLSILLILMSSVFANGQLRETSCTPPVDRCGWAHRFDGYYGDGFGNYCDVNCCQAHINGYFFYRGGCRYFPDYQHPRFGYYGHHYHPLIEMQSCQTPKGFYRCYNREGLSVEQYVQHGRRG